MTTRFTLEELVDLIADGELDDEDYAKLDLGESFKINNEWFYYWLMSKYNITVDVFYKEQNITKLFALVWQKYKGEFTIDNFIRFFNSKIRLTFDKYNGIINIYENNKANLMNRVKSINKFNNTPQGSGDFSDDTHATNVTINESEVATIMGRIKEIDDSLRNYWEQWVKEFGGLFYYE